MKPEKCFVHGGFHSLALVRNLHVTGLHRSADYCFALPP